MPVSYIKELGNSVSTPNAAYTRLPHRITSDDPTRPQYQFIMDIYESGSSEYITRHTQRPNEEGKAIFEPSRVIQGVLDYDQYWKITGSIAPNNSVKDFVLQFGEQYGTSPSSSVTVYPNQASHSLTIFPGVVNPMEDEYYVPGNLWNFNTSSFEGNNSVYLTNNPANRASGSLPNIYYSELLSINDYYTVTPLRDTFIDPDKITISGTYFSNGSTGLAVTGSIINLPNKFATIGIGPKNLADWDTGWANYLASGSINTIYTGNDTGGVVYFIKELWDGVLPTGFTSSTFETQILIPEYKCNDEYTRFAFINTYGFWDYYNIYNPVKIETDLDRKTWNRPQVRYDIGGVGYYAPYTGMTQDYLSSKDRHSIDTDYIDKETANWLEELIQSPEVFIQQGDNFVPIVLTNSSYESNNSTGRNKLFKYTIEWVYANPRRSRI